jgi:hypothetical protein
LAPQSLVWRKDQAEADEDESADWWHEQSDGSLFSWPGALDGEAAALSLARLELHKIMEETLGETSPGEQSPLPLYVEIRALGAYISSMHQRCQEHRSREKRLREILEQSQALAEGASRSAVAAKEESRDLACRLLSTRNQLELVSEKASAYEAALATHHQALTTAEQDLMLALGDAHHQLQEDRREGEMYEGEAENIHTLAKTAEKGVQIDANEAGGTVDEYGCVMDQDVKFRQEQVAKHHAVQAELVALRAQHEDLMHERDILAAEVAAQAQRAAQVQQSLQAELVAAPSLHEELHPHVASQRPRDQLPQKVEALASADFLGQDALFEQTYTRGCMHAEGEPHQDSYPDLDFPGAGAQYVRREVLELVKLKAKADLAQLESELMAVIQAMENRGAAGRGNAESSWLTPDLTQAFRPQSADNSPSPGEVREMTWATRTTSAPPAWREGLNTQRRQRASGIAVESMRQEQKDSLERMNAEHNVARHGMTGEGIFTWNPVSDSMDAEMDRGSMAGEHTANMPYTITALIAAGAAEKSGLLDIGERIVAVNGTCVAPLHVEDVTAQIRGSPNTPVTLTIAPPIPEEKGGDEAGGILDGYMEGSPTPARRPHPRRAACVVAHRAAHNEIAVSRRSGVGHPTGTGQPAGAAAEALLGADDMSFPQENNEVTDFSPFCAPEAVLEALDLEREARKAREAREVIRQDALRAWGAEIEGLRQLGWSLSQSLAFAGLLCV